MNVITEVDVGRYQQAQRRPWIYVAGPMTGSKVDPEDEGPYANPREAFFVAQALWHRGWHPVVPQTSILWELVAGPLDDVDPEANGWLHYDISLLTKCQALVRLPGASAGADREVALMKALGKPVVVLADHWSIPQASDCFRLVEGRWEVLLGPVEPA